VYIDYRHILYYVCIKAVLVQYSALCLFLLFVCLSPCVYHVYCDHKWNVEMPRVAVRLRLCRVLIRKCKVNDVKTCISSSVIALHYLCVVNTMLQRSSGGNRDDNTDEYVWSLATHIKHDTSGSVQLASI